jgi:hypothetical protein
MTQGSKGDDFHSWKEVVFIFHEQDSSSTLTASLPAFETDGRAAGCSKGGKGV